MSKPLGPDTDSDTIDDQPVTVSMNRFFSHLDQEGLLARTIVHNLNSYDTELMVANAYNFNDGSVSGKMQYRATWWFPDQIKGVEGQPNALPSLGLLSHLVGMLTDFHSSLSYPRHKYFRRILCSMLGNEIEEGLLLASEFSFIEQTMKNISYSNAKRYFDF